MSSDTVILELGGLSGAHLMAVEHAEFVVALYAAMTALDDNGLYQEASAARAVLLDGNASCPLTGRNRAILI